MEFKTITLVAILGFVATCSAQTFFEEEIEAWHFHIYFFEVNDRMVDQALTLRRALRSQIDNGTFPECSLNEIAIGWDGPHPVSQYELCCNKTSFAVAHSYFTQNHQNLSVLVHPLTIFDQEDHASRGSWIGKETVIDIEFFDEYPILPTPRVCPVYPRYSDDLPTMENYRYKENIPGTEYYSRNALTMKNKKTI